MKQFIKNGLDATLVKTLRYINVKSVPANPGPYKLNTHRILWERAIMQSADYVERHLNKIMLYQTKEQLWDYALTKLPAGDGLYLEFGVHKGKSINYFSQRMSNVKFYGFDSFVGLAEDWVGHHRAKGAFDLKGNLPKVSQNVELIQGWFDKTLPPFIEQNIHKDLIYAHIDGDTYEAAVIVLNALQQKIKPGVILLFDEYLGYPNWQNGEFKAWQDFCAQHNIQYRYLAFSTDQALIEIL